MLERLLRRKTTVLDLSPLHPLSEPFAGVLRSMYEQNPDTKITPAQGMLIFELCRSLNAERTCEVGLAHGFSTVYFLAATPPAQSTHTAIDPLQTEVWRDAGLKNIQYVGGSDRVRVIQDYSYAALPTLIGAKEQFDVIFIDGGHRFDDVLLDFTLSAMLCREGGCIVLDDMWMPSIRKVASFIRSNRPDFEEVGDSGEEINTPVFRKIGNDNRDWQHFEKF